MTPTPNPGEARPEPTPRTDLIIAGLPEHTNQQACFDGQRGYWVQSDCVLIEADSPEAAISTFRYRMANGGNIACLHNLGTSGINLALARRSLAEAHAKLEAAEKELDYLKDYAIPEKDKHGKYWHDLAQERIAKLAQLESERENWRVSSVCRELAKDRERIEYVRKNFANAIHCCCRIDGDEWNTKFYETLDKWMARDADRKGDGK